MENLEEAFHPEKGLWHTTHSSFITPLLTAESYILSGVYQYFEHHLANLMRARFRRVRASDSHFITDVCRCQEHYRDDFFRDGVLVAAGRATAACLSQLSPAAHANMMFL
jgi:hypothetical protein